MTPMLGRSPSECFDLTATGTSGLSGRAIAILLILGTCAIAALTVRWDRTRTKVGAFYDIAPRLGGIAPVGLSNKGKTSHYRVAFKGPQIFAVRRMTARGGPLPLFDSDDPWNWFLNPHEVCTDCGAEIYGAVMTYEGDNVARVDFRTVDSESAQHYTVHRDGGAFHLEHSAPSPDRGLRRETHVYDAQDRISERRFEGGSVHYTRDEQGRVIVEKTEGSAPRTLRYTYGESRHPARPTEVASDRADAYGCHTVQTDWDSIGHPVQIRCLDATGSPVVSTVGCAAFDLYWVDEHWTTACLDVSGSVTASRPGWTFSRVLVDPMAFPAVIAWLDADGNEIAAEDGTSRVHIQRNERGQVLNTTRFGPEDSPL